MGYPSFREVAEESIGYEVDYDNTKIQWLDFDSDGDLDMVNLGKSLTRVYEKGEGAVLFSLNTTFFPEDLVAQSINQIDIDNDGQQDFYFSMHNTSYYGVKSIKNNLLLMSRGKEGLVSAPESGIMTDSSITVSSHWYDFNQDGYLDLLLNNVDENQLYKNNGDNSFDLVTIDDFKGKQFDNYVDKPFCFWFDFNKDGKADFLISQSYYSRVFLQGENDSFTSHELSAVFEVPQGQGGIRNINDILLQDITLNKQEDLNVVYGGRNTIFVYDSESGKYKFLPFEQYNFKDMNSPITGTSIDYDNDGDLDLVFDGSGNGYSDEYSIAFNHNVYGNFSYIVPFSQQPLGKNADYVSWVDLNEDGFPDLVKSDRLFMKVFMNNGNDYNWLKVRLKGNSSNIDGIGAIITTIVGGNRQTRIIKEVSFQRGQSGRQAHFGLKNDQLIDSLIVQWPSGCRQLLLNVTANQSIKVEENCAGNVPVASGSSACLGVPLTATIDSPGKIFNWYSSLNGPLLGTSGNSLTLDTLTVSRTLFVENADSTIASRKVPVKFTVFPIPEVDLVFNGDTLQTTEQAVSYTWYLNGEILEGVTGNFLLPKNNGSYFVEVVNEFRCVNRSEEKTIEIMSIQKQNQEKLRIYPNPVKEYLFVKGVKPNSFYKIVDIQGKVVLQGNLEDYQVPLTRLSQGLYFLSLPENEHNKLLLLMKE